MLVLGILRLSSRIQHQCIRSHSYNENRYPAHDLSQARHRRQCRIRRWDHALSMGRCLRCKQGIVTFAHRLALHGVQAMEHQPINVVLLAPGAVKSNIAANQTPHVHLPPDSLYKDYFDLILERLTRVQENSPMPTEVYAQTTVNAALRRRPLRYMSLGKMTGWAKVFQWLPRGWVLNVIWSRLGEGRRRAAAQKVM